MGQSSCVTMPCATRLHPAQGVHVMTRTKTIRLIALAQDVAPRSALCRKHIVHTTGGSHMTYQQRPVSKGGLPTESR